MKFYVEEQEFSGVVKIADKVAKDVFLVTGKRPEIVVVNAAELPQMLEVKTAENEQRVIIGTIEKSGFFPKEAQGIAAEVRELKGKRECYQWFFPKQDEWTPSTLVIAGSDKRGTIYGLFHLSELIGVSPFVDWCGVKPPHRDKIEWNRSVACVSKEPSVKYRGFFINDEWPAFGNWCTKNFGGFNAKVYEHVFELLLRLKGNYLWPAMWSARFEDDGPGLLNAELADEYGVIMGMSHHEPCLRQGEEYTYLRGKDSIYGDAWNFLTNREGITRFWEDGLKRSGKFENVITVGMRGEADTAIMGKEATLADNIELLREVLKTQRRLIRENVNEDLTKVPRMIALYKEVEEFFYGNETTKGLMGDEELRDVILMLCDDNYGNLRTLPTEKMRTHKGGYGMYYHFDYHGWPISYEWINSSYLPKIWEQMTMAYDFGVRDLWIVNVGDIATQEFPLSFFLDIAYDFEQWGSTARNCAGKYTKKWVRQQFGALQREQQEAIEELLFDYTRLIHRRRPEALRPDTYHPVNYCENRRLLKEVEHLLSLAKEVYDRVEGGDKENLSAYVSLVYYPAVGTMNLLRMQLLSGLNHYCAGIGALAANDYGQEAAECMEREQELIAFYHEIDDGKWYGMGLSQHIGFTQWNEDECQNPVIMQVLPLTKPAIIVTVDGTKQHAEGSPWLDNRMELNDFLNPDCKEAGITLYARGHKLSEYRIAEKPEWIFVDSEEGSLDGRKQKIKRISVTVDKAKLPMASGEKVADGRLVIETPDGACEIKIPVYMEEPEYQSNTFVDTMGYISIEAEHYVAKREGEQGFCFECLQEYGKTLSAMKAFPTTTYADTPEKAPELEYRLVLPQAGVYEAEFYMQPSNPVTTENEISFWVQVNHQEIRTVNVIEEDYRVGDHAYIWAEGVLNQIRKKTVPINCQKGPNVLTVYAATPGFVLEKIVIYPIGNKPAESYLGPLETYRCR